MPPLAAPLGRSLSIAAVLLLAPLLAACPLKTAVDYTIEARSADDIARDNEIFIEVNRIMVDIGNIDAATEIYEQRLLITGLFTDREDYDSFKRQVEAVEGVKQLYWHATYLTPEQKEARDEELLSWTQAIALDTEIGVALFNDKGVADVNYRVAVDPFATAYLMGRARSGDERAKALAAVRGVAGVRRVVDYVDVRP